MAQSRVLWVMISNQKFPVTLDTVYQVFSRIGKVNKICMFRRETSLNVMLEMATLDDAQRCKTQLNGRDIYDNCCTLTVDYSKHEVLSLKANDPNSRDFTLPAAANTPTVMGPGMVPAHQPPHMQALAGYPAGFANRGRVPGAFGMGGVPPPQPLPGQMQMFPAPPHQLNMAGAMAGGLGAVVLVSNLNEELVTADNLFNVVGHYADVMRVRFTYSKRSVALVQLRDASRTEVVVQVLNGKALKGSEMKVSFSKHPQVRAKQESETACTEYGSSKAHRFARFGSKAFQNVFPPHEILHVSNLPAEMSDEQLTALFALPLHGEVKEIRRNDAHTSMARVTLSSTEAAINALADLNNMELEGRHIRLSFAKTAGGRGSV